MENLHKAAELEPRTTGLQLEATLLLGEGLQGSPPNTAQKKDYIGKGIEAPTRPSR